MILLLDCRFGIVTISLGFFLLLRILVNVLVDDNWASLQTSCGVSELLKELRSLFR
jgi:hypothetical protein